MTNEFYSIVTDYGIQKQVGCLNNGVNFDIYEIALGDGNGSYYEPNSSQTQLKHEVWRGVISNCKWEKDKFYCIVNVPAKEGGFYIREAGVFDKTGNMITITKFPETYKQTPDSGTVKQLTIKIEVHFTNNQIAQLIINPNIESATKAEFEELTQNVNSQIITINNNYQKTEEKGQVNGYAPLDSEGYVPDEHIKQKSAMSIFDIVQKDHILSFEESKGYALLGTYLYKEGMAGSRYGYPDFYNKCLNEYFESENYILKNNISIIGKTLTINDGIATDFSPNSYLAGIKCKPLINSDTFEIKIRFTTGTLGTIQNLIRNTSEYQNFALHIIETKQIAIYISSNGTSYDIAQNLKSTLTLEDNTEYYIKISFTGDEYLVDISNDDINWINYITIENSTICTFGDLQIGSQYNLYPSNPIYWLGSINLKNSYIKINNEILWQGTLNGKRHNNGHVYYDIEQKYIADDIYDTYGIAWFYGIDVANERIFLPRNDFIFQNGTIENIGKIKEAGLPNITGATAGMQGANEYGGDYGCFYQEYLASSTDQAWSGGGEFRRHVFDASRSSKIYGNSDTVQMPSVNVLAYMVVGSTEVRDSITEVLDVSTTENDTVPLFTGQYFDFKPNNLSWLKAGTQKNCGNLYSSAYSQLIASLTNNTNALKVIETKDMIEGSDYSEYWKINQDDMTFQTPSKINWFSTLGQRFLVAKKEPTENDPSWYNWYSDGWCEQGNIVDLGSDITASCGWSDRLLVPYKNNNYSRLAVDAGNTAGSGHVWLVTCTIPSSSNTRIGGYCLKYETSIRYVSWRAAGYASVPNISDFTENLNLYFKVANAVQNLDIVNVAKLTEAVNEKISNLDCSSYVIETYKNGNSWYRVWSDGWLEQGGCFPASNSGWSSQTVTFLKNFINTDYTLLARGNWSDAGSSSLTVTSKTISSFVATVAINTLGATGSNWYACGY